MTTGHVGQHRASARRRSAGRRPLVVRRRRITAAAVVLLLALVVAVVVRVTGPSSEVALTPGPQTSEGAVPDAEGAPGDGAVPVPTTPAETAAPAEAAAPVEPAAPQADPATVLAGILAPGVPDVGTGEPVVVPGSQPPPDPAGDVVQVKVSVEGGLPVDGSAFAAFVMATLNDGRSWTHDGYSFARTDGDADVEVVLASPQTSAQMCAPLETMGTLSCRNGGRAVLTYYRWANLTEDYASDPTGYRTYVVNHEVGHFLGHGHEQCPGAGELAPVMMQQTKGIGSCVRNPFPFP